MTDVAPRIVALVPARDEEATVGNTVEALLRLPIGEVVVVDDGSSDATTSVALAAGATVLRIPGHAGKGGAMEGALLRLPPADIWLFTDADLGSSAEGLGTLLEIVVSGRADLGIALFPRQDGGGLGTVKRSSAGAIRLLSGFRADEPLSGQRAITAACLDAVRPFAGGFGVETAMTIDAVRAGFRVVEVPVPGLTHRATSRSFSGFVHRGRQGVQIARAATARAIRLRGDRAALSQRTSAAHSCLEPWGYGSLSPRSSRLSSWCGGGPGERLDGPGGERSLPPCSCFPRGSSTT